MNYNHYPYQGYPNGGGYQSSMPPAGPPPPQYQTPPYVQGGYGVPPSSPQMYQSYGQHPGYAARPVTAQTVGAAIQGLHPHHHAMPQSPPSSNGANHPMVLIPQKSPEYLQSFRQHETYPPQQVQPQRSIPQPQPRPQLQSQPQPQYPQHQPQYRPAQHQMQRQAQHPPQLIPQQGVAPPPQKARPQTSSMQPQQARSHPQVVIQQPPRTPSSSAPTSAKAAITPATPSEPAIDYHLLLLSLAEEYITAAHTLGPIVALYRRQKEEQEYYKLMATGLGCMEAVLKKYRLAPRQEATLRLRYASLLHDETENDMEAETILSKGITLCDRNRLKDLKYGMHHLLARVMAKTNAKAALRSLDGVVAEVEAYQHTAWVYALRFLRVSLSMQIPDHPDTHGALQNLKAISNVAETQGDRAIFVTCATLEAMVHIMSFTADSIEQAQRAIASARSLQLQFQPKELAQVWALLDFIDLSCSLQQFNPEQAQAKMGIMQRVVDQTGEDIKGNDAITFAVPIERSSGGQLTDSVSGLFHKKEDGRNAIVLSWLCPRDLYVLGYCLSGAAAHYRNNVDHKAEKYLNEGVKITQDMLNKPSFASQSLTSSTKRLQWQAALNWRMQLSLLFILCDREDWEAAKASLSTLGKFTESPLLQATEEHKRWLAYMRGMISQGGGDLDAAFAAYQSPLLALPTITTARSFDPQSDLCILATLNSLLILRDPTHPAHSTASTLLTSLEPLCVSHSNRSITSAYHLLLSISRRSDSLLKSKQCLQLALTAAKSVPNHQLLAISMNFMTAMYFKDIVGEQAEKSARTGRLLARKNLNSDLWTCVADGMLADTLECHGKGEQAGQARREMTDLGEKLAPSLRERCMVDEGV